MATEAEHDPRLEIAHEAAEQSTVSKILEGPQLKTICWHRRELALSSTAHGPT
jgi:hypothetical protein